MVEGGASGGASVSGGTLYDIESKTGDGRHVRYVRTRVLHLPDGTIVVKSVHTDSQPSTASSLTEYFMHNNPTPPTGDTSSQVSLPLNTTSPIATLYNYDQDRDAFAGLLIAKGRHWARGARLYEAPGLEIGHLGGGSESQRRRNH